jgi:type II secretory pathway pseudopilin PulG
MVIVIAIMGIIAAIVIPNVTDFLGSGKEESWKSDKQAIQVAIDSYYAAGNSDDPIIGTELGVPTLTSASAFTTDEEDGAIDFSDATLLGYIHDAPESASVLNAGGTGGAYVWYLDADKDVQSAYWDTSQGDGYWTDHYPD